MYDFHKMHLDKQPCNSICQKTSHTFTGTTLSMLKIYSRFLILYSGFYLRSPTFCKSCEVLMSSQILILQLLCYHQHVLQPCEPATEHVILAPGFPRKATNQVRVLLLSCLYMQQRQKGHCDFVCHGDKPVLLLLHLTTPPRKGMYPLMTDLTVNESTLDSMARVTAGAYNRNINKRYARKLIWPCKTMLWFTNFIIANITSRWEI